VSGTTSERLAFCFGVHDHQPVGQFDAVLGEATERAYHPFLARLVARGEVRLTLHASGSLLAWLRERAPRTFDLLGTLAARGQVELLTGGFWEPIVAVLPDHDKRGQIAKLSEFLRASFGVRPRGMWLAERVWEPHLAKALRDAGVEYVLLDDSHFTLAGLEPDTLGGYYLTEEQGTTLAVFPISQRLRYLIPFAPVDKTLDHLAERRGRAPAVTVIDDGEKFGVWPGTHEHVYAGGWLDQFFDLLLATPWLDLATLGEVRDRVPPAGRVYLPAASYREMGEWALPVEAADALDAAREALARVAGGEQLGAWLRGGFWRAFLVKYPEVAETHWKMLRLSTAIDAALRARPGDARLVAAREALWRGQANDAYWHGVFGGCYLPHLRRAVKGALLEAERGLAGPTPEPVALTTIDADGDGAEEILVRTPRLTLTLRPAAGGTLTEIGDLGRALDLADVMTRRRETYHARLVRPEAPGAGAGVRTIHEPPGAKETGLAARLGYDDLRRASLLDGLFEPGAALDPVAPWPAARVACGGLAFAADARVDGDRARITLRPVRAGALPLALDKRVEVRDATVEARYRLARAAGGPDTGRWAVQWNLALTAGDAPGRYLTLPGRPSLGSAGRVREVDTVALVDEWIGVEARLEWSPGAELAWGPVETVSVSEGGFERIYQGTALLLAWPVALGDAPAELWTRLTVIGR